jgi:biopolymer transport protein ExbB
MAIIALVSIFATTIIVERLISLRRGRVVPERFLKELRSRAGDHAAALALCKSSPAPVARVIATAIKNAGAPTEIMEKRVEESGQREVLILRHRMRVLSALPQTSTMLGLLGTIFGMIKTFQSIASSGQALGKTELLAKGIYEAWTATAAGLLVAIPVLICYHALMGRIDARAADIDRAVNDWTASLDGPDPVAPHISQAAPSINGVATNPTPALATT